MTDIKLIHKDTVLPKLVPMDWDVVIHGKPHYVVRIESFVHTIGGRWGDNCYWAYPRNMKPSYNTLVEFNCENPVRWGIRYEPTNYLSSKWGECEARSGGKVTITRNGQDFCDVPGAGINFGIDQARIMITEFQEHPLDLNSIKYAQKAIGMKVWWRSEPAIVTDYIDGQACVMLSPDGIPRFTTPAEYADEGDDYYEDGIVKADILDKHINWFRG